ncbi:hypothetical protein ACHAXS_004786, partial [Conticribra weissflogii]
LSTKHSLERTGVRFKTLPSKRSSQRGGGRRGINRTSSPKIDALALSFYDSKLRNDPALRRSCEDRHVLDRVIDEWKAHQGRRGTDLKGASRSAIIFSLRARWKLIEAKITEENILVWKDDPGSGSGANRNDGNHNHNHNRDGATKPNPRKASKDKSASRVERIADAVERIRRSRQEQEANRNGVEVDFITFGKAGEDEGVHRVGETLCQTVAIRNDAANGTVRCRIRAAAAKQRGFEVEGETEDVELGPGECQDIRVSFTPRELGVVKTYILFEFRFLDEFDEERDPFEITRYVSVRGGDPDDYEFVKPTSPYVRKKPKWDGDKFKDPIRAPATGGAQQKFARVLATYPIPGQIGKMMREKKDALRYMDAIYLGHIGGHRKDFDENEQVDYSKCLTMDNYSQCFQNLLWMEEIQMKGELVVKNTESLVQNNVVNQTESSNETHQTCSSCYLFGRYLRDSVDIKCYDMENAPLLRHGHDLYKIHVPGLAENRPSILKGDKIIIHSQDQKFEGVVQRTTQEDAILKFHPRLQDIFLDGMKVHVRFTFTRTTIRTSHQAVVSCDSAIDNPMLSNILFPEETVECMSPLNSTVIQLSQLRFYNRYLNAEQQAAVLGIVRAVKRPAPYLIYGPPGTGKTVTLVEAIIQTIRAPGADSNARILVCAPSNSATDVVVERLMPYFRPSEMIRIIAYSRDRASVPTAVMNYTSYDEHSDCFVVPPANLIKSFKIVAVTVSSGGRLPNNNVLGHFTHVFIDEAGHSIEPEAIACMVSTTRQDNPGNAPAIVVAGDPKQLGPIIRSEVCQKFGLGKSLLERLSERDAYKRIDDPSNQNHHDNRMITKLVRNYRSHPSILKLPNEAFYDGDLIAAAEITRSHRFAKWEHLPTKNFPIIFHGCEGEDKREGNSPSWFNPDEAQLVKMYVDLLVKDTRNNRCKPDEIGIITPYHKQVQKIRLLLNAHGYSECKVGSVEEFQGEIYSVIRFILFHMSSISHSILNDVLNWNAAVTIEIGSERPVIIISTVRSTVDYIQFDSKYKLGFLASEKRFNVAITRAQALLVIIGNPYTLETDRHWKQMIDVAVAGGGYKGCQYTKAKERGENTDAISEFVRGIKSISLDEEKDDDGEVECNLVSHITAQEGPAWRSEE